LRMLARFQYRTQHSRQSHNLKQKRR
jgi:hypothetical protein